MTTCSIIGFDAAWTDHPKACGAVTVLRHDGARVWLHAPPKLARYDEVADIAEQEREITGKCLIALDQPTIVPNETGSRLVERVVASQITFMGGGVQPTSRARKGMFDDAAPIWRFRDRLLPEDDPHSARLAEQGVFLMEVFPALALAGIHAPFAARKAQPKYNPARRATFKPADWIVVAEVVAGFASHHGLAEVEDWCRLAARISPPKKADQDRLDSVICALIGLHWLYGPKTQSMIIGSLNTGYIVAPVLHGPHQRIIEAAARLGLPVG